ncbi:MAG: diguanylate cyclase domain-containing protein [Thioalkalivibrionaceae bacterium]
MLSDGFHNLTTHGAALASLSFALILLSLALVLMLLETRQLKHIKRDHEDQVRTLESLIQSEAEARERILDGLPVIAFAFDLSDGSTHYLSRNAARLLGITPRDARKQRDWWTVGIHPDDLERHADRWVSLEHPDRRRRYRFQHFLTRRWLVIEEAARLEKDGMRTMVYGTMTDVTADQKRVETIETEHRRLTAVVEGGHLGTWEYHPPSERIHLNRRSLELLDEPPDSLEINTLESFFARIHPADREAYKRAWQLHVDCRSPHFQIELRVQTRSGGWRWIQSTGRIITRDTDGRPLSAFGVHRDIDEDVKNRERLNRLASRDELTDLPNRRQFISDLHGEIEAIRRWHHESIVAIFDIDFFKRVNDDYGHAAGDTVLIEVAQRIQANLRPRDHIGRLGGEEFGLILAGCELPAGPSRTLERLRRALESKPVRCEQIDIPITASFGATLLRPEDTADAALARADVALYEAKHAGRNRYAIAIADRAWLTTDLPNVAATRPRHDQKPH